MQQNSVRNFLVMVALLLVALTGFGWSLYETGRKAGVVQGIEAMQTALVEKVVQDYEDGLKQRDAELHRDLAQIAADWEAIRNQLVSSYGTEEVELGFSNPALPPELCWYSWQEGG